MLTALLAQSIKNSSPKDSATNPAEGQNFTIAIAAAIAIATFTLQIAYVGEGASSAKATLANCAASAVGFVRL